MRCGWRAGKGADRVVAGAEFWGPYVEEWKVPPIERAERFAQKQPFYAKLAGPIFRLVILKGACFAARRRRRKSSLTPCLHCSPPYATQLCSIPEYDRFGGPTEPQPKSNDPSARERSFPFADPSLTTSFFPVLCRKEDDVRHYAFLPSTATQADPAPHSPFQQSLFLVERLPSYRTFALICALTERIPLLGLVFALSNPIGAAMWSHDLEKRQHAFARGEIERTEVYVSKTASVENELPKEFVGGFPGVKSPLKIS